MLAADDGHKAVLAAMSDFRIAYDEDFRFETLLSTLRLPQGDIDSESDSDVGFGNEEEGVWEARISTMALVNALTNCPEKLEDRMILREEFGRRGLNELIVVRVSALILEWEWGSEIDYETGSSIHQASRFLNNTIEYVHRGEI